eukprot:6190233-Pleurochrysis_carterae.AAC.1
MGTSYREGDISIRSEMNLNGIVTSRPERVIVNVSMRLNMTHTGQTEAKGGSPNDWLDLIGIVHRHILSKKLVLYVYRRYTGHRYMM